MYYDDNDEEAGVGYLVGQKICVCPNPRPLPEFKGS